MAVLFDMSPQLGGIVPKFQDLVTSFQLIECESLPGFHLQSLQPKIEIYKLNDNIFQGNNLACKCSMEISKLQLLQHYIASLKMDYRKF